MSDIRKALKVEAEIKESLLDQVIRLQAERDNLAAKIQVFLETFKVGHSGGAPSHPARMYITAWKQDEIMSSIPSEKVKYDALYALWEAVNSKSG